MTIATMAPMTKKITISLPDEQVAAAQRAVAEGRTASVSAFISAALARRDPDREALEWLDEMVREHGPITEEHTAWARRALGLDE
jgi:Arc/MetJ-type ribon-helix-helix transcriptional regulator